MGVVVLHVGAANTGTSALQSAFAKTFNSYWQNIIYPDDESLERVKLDRITSGHGVPLAKLLGGDL
jgi:hypothetical protein